MSDKKKSIEVTGIFSNEKELLLDVPLPSFNHKKVKVNITLQDESDEADDLFKAAAKNPAFGDIFDESEDVYTLEDGKPFDN